MLCNIPPFLWRSTFIYVRTMDQSYTGFYNTLYQIHLYWKHTKNDLNKPFSHEEILKKYKFGKGQRMFKIESTSNSDQISILMKVNNISVLGVNSDLLKRLFIDNETSVTFSVAHCRCFKQFQLKLESNLKSVKKATADNKEHSSSGSNDPVDDHSKFLEAGSSNQAQEAAKNEKLEDPKHDIFKDNSSEVKNQEAMDHEELDHTNIMSLTSVPALKLKRVQFLQFLIRVRK